MLQPGRSYSVGNGYRFGFNGKENDNEVKGTGNQQDYGMRIYDPRLGRFLSVDPLTKGFPMLTPYQFASNRPIDGIDLEGGEWKKIESYDPETGITNIHFQVKIKIENGSQILTNSHLKNIGAAISQRFMEAYDLYDEKRQIQYSGSLDYEVVDGELSSDDYGISIGDDNEGGSKIKITGLTASVNTQKNLVFVDGTSANGAGVFRTIDIDQVAETAIHEFTHTAGVIGHPFDPENEAQDVDLTPLYYKFDPKRSNLEFSNTPLNGFTLKTYLPSEGANETLIMKNIMMYYMILVNDEKPLPNSLRKVSPDQAKKVSEQVEKETHNR